MKLLKALASRQLKDLGGFLAFVYSALCSLV